MTEKPKLYLATRGSALALAQAHTVEDLCREAFPDFEFEPRIIKTTGDKLQTASMAREGQTLPRGLFTKELEMALLDKSADLAVHSLKDLPTDLPAGLVLGAVLKRADVRDVLIYRDRVHKTNGGRCFAADAKIADMPAGTVVATSSTRRKAQLIAINPGLKVVEIRGNVLTRMQKLARQTDIDATILALAGLSRLDYSIAPDGHMHGEGVPEGLLARILEVETMLPCVGQGAIGIEIRGDDERAWLICEKLNDAATFSSVTAERSFLAQMGGGCQSPVAALAEASGGELKMRALSFTHGPIRKAEASSAARDATDLGRKLAAELKG
jgi:hydroxymethylbilane synthase